EGGEGAQRRIDAEALEEHAGTARVLAGDEVHAAQRLQGARGDVVEVAEGRPHEKEPARLAQSILPSASKAPSMYRTRGRPSASKRMPSTSKRRKCVSRTPAPRAQCTAARTMRRRLDQVTLSTGWP